MKKKIVPEAEPAPEPLLLQEPVVEEPTSPLPPPPAEQPPQRQGSFVAPLLGGAIAAVAGFAFAEFDVLGLRSAPVDSGLSAGLKSQAEDIAGLRAALDGGRADLSTRITALENAEPLSVESFDPSGIEQRLTDLEDRLASAEQQLPGAADPALTATVRDLAARVDALGAGVPAEVTAEVDAALERLAAAEAEAEASTEEAAAATAATLRAQAIDRLRAGVDSGAAFDPLLRPFGDESLPPALSANAATGVATVAQLQEDFTEAARTSLRVETSASDHGWGARFVDFLQAQTGARPLTPREGTDTASVLSRAEAALADGNVEAALGELRALDPAVAAPLADWMAAAEQRAAVDAALAGLAAQQVE